MGSPGLLILSQDYMPETTSIIYPNLVPGSAWQELPVQLGPCSVKGLPSPASHLGRVTTASNTHQLLGPQPNCQMSETTGSGEHCGMLVGGPSSGAGPHQLQPFLSLGIRIRVCQLFRFSRNLEIQVFGTKSPEVKCWKSIGVSVDDPRTVTAHQTEHHLQAELALGQPWSLVLPALAAWLPYS